MEKKLSIWMENFFKQNSQNIILSQRGVLLSAGFIQIGEFSGLSGEELTIGLHETLEEFRTFGHCCSRDIGRISIGHSDIVVHEILEEFPSDIRTYVHEILEEFRSHDVTVLCPTN